MRSRAARWRALAGGGLSAALIIGCGSGSSPTSTISLTARLSQEAQESPQRGDSDQVHFPLTPLSREYAHWEAQQARDFDQFPLYWVGEEFQGYPITDIIRSVSGPDALVPEDSVTFLYGTCTPPAGEGGCADPLQIVVEPYCFVPPSLVGASNPIEVRGGAEAFNSDGWRLWTGKVTVRIFAYLTDLQLAAIDALVSANGMGPASPSELLPTPDADCSDFGSRPIH